MSAPLPALLQKPAIHELREGHDRYICLRVLDALLREDVRQCVTLGEVMARESLPGSLLWHTTEHAKWLRIGHLSDECLWLPVTATHFMQRWRSAGLPVIMQQGARVRLLENVEDILAAFAKGVSESDAALYAAFIDECATAAEHKVICERERRRWFAETEWHAGALWHEQLLHFDRLGAFLDHPFYPTARAKLGFNAEALAAYGPEFQRSFELRWVAVPRHLHQPSMPGQVEWPELWPTMAGVGLPESLTETHALVPVHPFVWAHHLDEFLQQHGLDQSVIHAPKAYLTVRPTLSVRAVVLEQLPQWHLKLPLTIRTLGAKNIRTIKPSTIHDGHAIQTLLAELVQGEPSLHGRVLLTHEACGAHVQQQPFLGYILRRYPDEALQQSVLVPVATLLAETPEGGLVAQRLAQRFYDGDLAALLSDYLDLTLQLHLRLWLRYGIALESNQQNSVLVLSEQAPRLRLLLKDNDAARIHPQYLQNKRPDLAARVAELQDKRILVDAELPLAQMFITITLQLNIAVLVEGLAPQLGQPPQVLYADVRRRIAVILETLAQEGADIVFARQVLLESEYLYAKYLLIAATLAEKTDTGATDVNKFYGLSVPNFLRLQP
jgi:siderophore synthetase component